MSLAAYCVAFASALAFVLAAVDPGTPAPGRPVTSEPGYPDESLQYLDKVHEATRSHHDDVMFLRKMMEVDYLWWPILNEPVKVKRPTVPYFDQYKEPAPVEYVENSELPFELISTMMTENTFTGSDVVFVMNAFKSAMACSVLKHVSLQALMLHALLTKFSDTIPDDERVMFEGWLANMVQVAVDKLTAMDHSQNPDQSITRVRALLVEMRRALSDSAAADMISKLHEIGMEMYAEIEKTCAVSNGEKGHYSALTSDLNREKRVEELKTHRTQLTENMREAADVHNVDIMHKYKGDIIIGTDITANDIADLDDDTMKRATAANHSQMNFLYLNLPIQILTESQWITISKSKIPISSKPTVVTQSV